MLVGSKKEIARKDPLPVWGVRAHERVLMTGAALLSALLAGCLFRAEEPPSKVPTITGVITKVETERTPLRILIEEKPDVSGGPELAGDKIYFSVDGTSIWVQRADGSWAVGGRDDLRVGSVARGWTSCGLVDTYPQQGCAGDIAILKPASQ